MKSWTRFFLASMVIACLGSAESFAQFASGNFRTHSPLTPPNNNWSAGTSWDKFNGSSWVNNQGVPSGSETIYIWASTDTVVIDVPVTITGTLIDSGRVADGAGALTIGSGGVYNRAKDAGRIPSATWSTGSTCLITGAAATSPSNANQNFYNFTWNCANQSANLNPGWNGNTVNGSVTVIASGPGSRFQFTAPPADSSRTTTIMGDVIVTGGGLSAQGTSNGLSSSIINHYGKIIATGGNFSVARGSQAGTGTTVWNFYGDSLILSNCTTQNSNPTGAFLHFAKAGLQTMVLNNVTWGSGTSPVNFTVDSNATLNLGTTVIPAANTGSLRVNPGGGLICGDPAGINGNVLCSGLGGGGGNLFSTQGNYTFNGTAAQATGSMLPATVNYLSLKSTAGITISNPVTVTGTLYLGGNGAYTNLNTVTGASSVTYAATVAQVTGAELASSVQSLTVNNGNGVTLSAADTVTGTLTLTAGILATGSNKLVLGSSATTSRTSGYVSGGLQKSFAASGSKVFEVGTANGYSPATVTVATGSGTVSVQAVQGAHPSVKNSAKTLARYWTIGSGGGITAAGITFQYLAADVNGSETAYMAGRLTGGSFNVQTTVINTSNHTATVASVDSLQSDWTVGENTALGVGKSNASSIPAVFFVNQNYPNPFNPSTKISYGLPKEAFVTATVYNILGQRVATLYSGRQSAGVHELNFAGAAFGSGIYLYKIQADNESQVHRMILIK
ncbi:MAG TPA: T9SS type A sorting domain-containing protein [Bacteroidota bacterium]|nr:T9SS type A sorting domain-containing protein [Bacteroidota bacterium]